MPPLRSYLVLLVLLVVVVPATALASPGEMALSALSPGALVAYTAASFLPLILMLTRRRH
jgi:hypothetical protein